MKKVTKEHFYKQLAAANKAGLDPMPLRKGNDWVCTRTYKVFGRVVHVGTGNKFEYFLS